MRVDVESKKVFFRKHNWSLRKLEVKKKKILWEQFAGGLKINYKTCFNVSMTCRSNRLSRWWGSQRRQSRRRRTK